MKKSQLKQVIQEVFQELMNEQFCQCQCPYCLDLGIHNKNQCLCDDWSSSENVDEDFAVSKKRKERVKKFIKRTKEEKKKQKNEVAPPGKEDMVLALKKKIKSGDMPKTYVDKKTGKRKKTNPWAIAWGSEK